MRYLLSFFLLLLMNDSLRAQEITPTIPLRIGIFTHSIGMPFKKPIKQPLNWGITAGTSFFYKQKNRNSFGQSIDLAWYRHKKLGQGLMIKTDVFREYVLKSGLSLQAKAGIGYLHTFNEKDLYALGESGSYEKIQDSGRSALLLGFGTRIGFDTGKNSSPGFKPFVEYEWRGQIPHSEFVPLFPHSFFTVGAEYPITQKKK